MFVWEGSEMLGGTAVCASEGGVIVWVCKCALDASRGMLLVVRGLLFYTRGEPKRRLKSVSSSTNLISSEMREK